MTWPKFTLWPIPTRVAEMDSLSWKDFLLPVSPASCLSCSGLTTHQRVGREWGRRAGVLGHLFPGAISPLRQSDSCKKALKHPSFFPHDYSGDSCLYFCTILKDMGTLVLFVIPCWDCGITAGLFTLHLLNHYLYGILLSSYVPHLVIRVKMPLMSWHHFPSLSSEMRPQVTSWWQPHEKPWARGSSRLLTHRCCKIMFVVVRS